MAMINEISYTLLADGSSDKALMPIIEWIIRQHYPTLLTQGVWADFSNLRNPPKALSRRIVKAIGLYPCDVLFIHRDSEKEPIEQRQYEIIEAYESVLDEIDNQYIIKLVPVRMMESWLLIDPYAIKKAAGNPNGQFSPVLPPLRSLEKISDPKSILHDNLRQASGLKGRQLDKFNVNKAVHLVAENISDFSNLKDLESFNYFEEEIKNYISFKLITINNS